jgi:hypothetical protein
MDRELASIDGGIGGPCIDVGFGTGGSGGSSHVPFQDVPASHVAAKAVVMFMSECLVSLPADGWRDSGWADAGFWFTDIDPEGPLARRD